MGDLYYFLRSPQQARPKAPYGSFHLFQTNCFTKDPYLPLLSLEDCWDLICRWHPCLACFQCSPGGLSAVDMGMPQSHRQSLPFLGGFSASDWSKLVTILLLPNVTTWDCSYQDYLTSFPYALHNKTWWGPRFLAVIGSILSEYVLPTWPQDFLVHTQPM